MDTTTRKQAKAAYLIRYRAENAEAIAQQRKQYRAENAEKVAEAKRADYQRRKLKIKAYLAKNADNIRETERLRRKRNAEKIRMQKKAWRAMNIENITAQEVAYRVENAARIAEVSRHYKATHRAEMTALTAARRARIMQATPPWADFDAIKAIYLEAGKQGKQVDHIIPLTHPLVCGLHVQANMQLLTRSENAKKRNKFTPG